MECSKTFVPPCICHLKIYIFRHEDVEKIKYISFLMYLITSINLDYLTRISYMNYTNKFEYYMFKLHY